MWSNIWSKDRILFWPILSFWNFNFKQHSFLLLKHNFFKIHVLYVTVSQVSKEKIQGLIPCNISKSARSQKKRQGSKACYTLKYGCLKKNCVVYTSFKRSIHVVYAFAFQRFRWTRQKVKEKFMDITDTTLWPRSSFIFDFTGATLWSRSSSSFLFTQKSMALQ